MGSSIGRILLWIIGGLVVVAASFFVTLQVLDYWPTPQDPNANVIHVVEATYGASCKDFTPQPPHTNTVKTGNASAVLTKVCDTAKASCAFTVDAAQIGDPANGCGKDFVAKWRCGNGQKIHQFFLSAESSGRTALLSCPAP
jgi:hypothetical protein